MFEESLVESTAVIQSRNRWPAMISVATQAALALLIIAVPLLHPEILPMHAPILSLTPPPAPKAPQPPPPQHVHAALASTSAPSAPSASPAAPSIIRTLLPTAPVADEPAIPASLGPTMMSNPSPLGIGDSRGNTLNVTATSTKPPAPAGPLHISAGVTAGLLLAPIVPQYPAIAKAARVEGTVIIHALISRTGSIEQAQVLSGSPMLQNAALEAVKTARYRPYLLNGQPTEVDTTITINFRLGS